ncbi:MAG: DUF2238 domain-containing protein [Steroidobacteraceae bacterium]
MAVSRGQALLLLAAVTAVLLGISGWKPYDRATWCMEVAPIVIAFPILWATYQRAPLTTLVYLLICMHAIVLMVGGAYTYARVPVGAYVQDYFHLSRNPYDKLGHLVQGFVPAMIAREIFIRQKVINGARMRAFLVICVVLAISATYEFLEWGAALAMGQGADEFLGLQGDEWDTQSDMFSALIGAIAALLLLSSLHDRQLRSVRGSVPG